MYKDLPPQGPRATPELRTELFKFKQEGSHLRKSYFGKRPKNKAAFLTLGTEAPPPLSSLGPSMNQTLPRGVFNERFLSH